MKGNLLFLAGRAIPAFYLEIFTCHPLFPFVSVLRSDNIIFLVGGSRALDKSYYKQFCGLNELKTHTSLTDSRSKLICSRWAIFMVRVSLVSSSESFKSPAFFFANHALEIHVKMRIKGKRKDKPTNSQESSRPCSTRQPRLEY